MKSPKLPGGPVRENPSTGRGGAPKFSKNWLPFACSPYDPDHIFALLYPPTAPGGARSHWLGLSRQTHISMGTFNKSQDIKTT